MSLNGEGSGWGGNGVGQPGSWEHDFGGPCWEKRQDVIGYVVPREVLAIFVLRELFPSPFVASERSKCREVCAG